VDSAPGDTGGQSARSNLIACLFEARDLRQRDRESRAREIRDRLRPLRRAPVSPAFRPRSFLNAAPQSLSESPWPDGTARLAYWLDRDENELVTYLLTGEGAVLRFATHLNPVVLDALQTVLTQFPEDELDYIVERLTGLLLPDRLLSALDDGGAHTVVVSADPGIPSVPWEALGAGGAQARPGLRAVPDAVPAAERRPARRCFLRTDPPSSHLLLADGPLTVAELAQAPTREGAVYVFGSCESAQQGTDAAYGNTFGVSAAFLLKGAAAVLGCNWPVDDRVTRAGTERLYAHLLAGQMVSDALKSARRDLFGRGLPTSSWALFTGIGDPCARLLPAE